MEQPYNEPHSGFWGRGTITAGIVVLIILLLLGWVLWGRNGNHTAAPPTPTTTTHGSQPTGNGLGGDGTTTTCNLPAGDQTVPEATPQGITWQLYQTVAVPYSKTDGPEIVDGDVARCYAHNPVGALLAVSQLGFRFLIAPDWRTVVQQQVVPNAGRSVYVSLRAQASNPGGNTAGTYNQLAGFKFLTYSPAAAVVDLVSKSGSGVMQVTTASVEWLNGDWKLELEPNGSESANALPVTSLVGFSTWSGV